jgi:hypothetical protein
MTKKSGINANSITEAELSARLEAKKILITRLKSQPIHGQRDWTRDELYEADPKAKPACSRSGWK